MISIVCKRTLQIILLATSFSSLSQADTAIKYSGMTTYMLIHAPKGVSFTVYATYTPLYKLDSSQDEKTQTPLCTFPEDEMSPNGPEKTFLIQTSNNPDGATTIQVPDAGLRGDCKYTLEVVESDMNFKGTALQNFVFRTKLDIKSINDALAISNSGPYDVTKIKNSSPMFCDFKSDAGTCFYRSDMLMNDFVIGGAGENVVLNIKDSSKDPNPDDFPQY